ncbi:glutathione S-transferase, C-terminal domain protein [Enterobacter cancerogenus ATCC 35316]|nr:glutathione S-transferase, C-terminal domain protein [Enterobacter cancerogenus ATCC 35316]
MQICPDVIRGNAVQGGRNAIRIPAFFHRLFHTDVFRGIKDQAMKLVGSYTSPFVRKISILLLEKGIAFEFVNEQPYNAENGVAQYNPLGKVPALVTDEGECWFDSPIIAEYIELLGIAPAMVPADPKAALAMKQTEALADGIMDAALASVREQARPAAQQSETELLRQREKISRSLDHCEQLIRDGKIQNDDLNLGTIAIACAIGYLNFRRVSPGWCVDRPLLVKLAETLFQRESFARTEPPKA